TADTTVSVTLLPFMNLAASGWYAGDVHVHTQHPPIQYDIPPALAKRIAQSEGLSVANLLDEDYQFTGAPDPVSDSTTILQYSYEFRTQPYGHVSIPGLHQPVASECCLEPEAPYPMNSDLAAQARQAGGLFTLAHPHSTVDDTSFCCWPGVGLGREL